MSRRALSRQPLTGRSADNIRKVWCAYWDLGGEGVAYHNADPQNHGSGELNPADGTYINEFRIHEGVDTSNSKLQRMPDPIDEKPVDEVVPPAPTL